MNHNEEVQVVGKALELEMQVAKANRDYNGIKSEECPAVPLAPKKNEPIKSAYPKAVTPKIDWKWLLIPTFVLSPVLGIGFFYFIGYLIWHNKKKKEAIAAFESSDEYKNQCAEIDKQYELDLADAENKYQEDMNNYKNVVMVEYENKREQWESEHNERLGKVKAVFDDYSNQLTTHYSTTQLIPSKYHDIAILKYIYDVISTSQYTFKEACEDYERDQQRQLETRRLEEQEHANYLAEQQAELLSEQNSIAEKARRDQNISNVVSAVQRHNTNKILKKW